MMEPDKGEDRSVTDDLAVQTFACVWDALTNSPAEAVTMWLRSDLMIAIKQTVVGWKRKRADAARRPGVGSGYV